jgi:ABC-type lipoprotein release transport system permease subunit
MDAVRMRAAHLVRAGWRATIFLALLAGLTGGVALGAWSAGRRTATAFDRFVEQSNLSDLTLVFCPPEMTEVDDESIFDCWRYDQEPESEIVRELPEVEAAGRAAFRGLTVAQAYDPQETFMASGLFSRDASLPRADGSPLMIEGRWYDTDAPDEIVVNEFLAERADLAVGDRLAATFWSWDELGSSVPDGGTFSGPTTEVEVVGIVRGVRDIAARTEANTLLVDESYLLGGPGVWAVTADAGGFPGVLVNARNHDIPAVTAALSEAFGDRPFNLAPSVGADQLQPVEEAIDYEAGAVFAFAALTALAGAIFAGQAVARQSRREWSDLPTLRAIGLSNRQASAAAAARGVPTGLLAAIVAAGLALVASPIGAIGVADTTELTSRVRVDGVVLAVGGTVVLLLTILATSFPVARATLGRRRRSRELVLHAGPLPPTATVGVGLALNGGKGGQGLPLGTAIASVALAAAAVAAALGLVASMRELTSLPERFGAPWDLSFGGILDDEAVDDASDLLATSPDVDAAAGIIGSDVEIDGRVYWTHAFAPVDGVDEAIRPPITEGREPIRDDEIALGAITMRQLGVSIGDTVSARSVVAGSEPFEMTVVGETLINDTYEGSPGLGAVATPDWIARVAPEAQSPDPFVLRLRMGADGEQLREEIEEAFPSSLSAPIRQQAIRNVERIVYVPVLLAAIVALLAIAALAHALIVSVRRHRRQFAVLKALGMGRRQVGTTIIWQATALGVVAVIAGVPAGIIAGRWGWRIVARQLGVASGPVVPIVLVTLVVVAVIVSAELVAVVPAWRAARMPPAEALRVE